MLISPDSANPSNIRISTIKRFFTPDYLNLSIPPVKESLACKLNEYALRIGIDHPIILPIIIELITHKKLRVIFRDFSEKISIDTHNADLNRLNAIYLYDSWIKTIKTEISDQSKTQLITIVKNHSDFVFHI